MSELKIGSRVRLIGNSSPFISMEQLGVKVGDEGTVIGLERNDRYPFLVKLDIKDRRLTFAECELELINEFKVDLL